MYNYEELKHEIFTDEGQKVFLKVRDFIHNLLETAGAFTMGKALKATTGDSWLLMACVDRLVELNEIKEITDDNVLGQNRVFVKKYERI